MSQVPIGKIFNPNNSSHTALYFMLKVLGWSNASGLGFFIIIYYFPESQFAFEYLKRLFTNTIPSIDVFSWSGGALFNYQRFFQIQEDFLTNACLHPENSREDEAFTFLVVVGCLFIKNDNLLQVMISNQRDWFRKKYPERW